jgi:hypothetical protein
MDSATGSIYFGDPGVDRHHLIIRNTLNLAQLRGAPENDDRVNSGIHPQAVIERVWRYTWRPRSSEFGDAIGSRDRASLEIHLEAAIERVWTCSWKP